MQLEINGNEVMKDFGTATLEFGQTKVKIRERTKNALARH